MSKYYGVKFSSGESRNKIRNGVMVPVDYMIVQVGETELYAEMENPSWNEEKGWYDDDLATFEDLKEEIIAQAIEKGIHPDYLVFS